MDQADIFKITADLTQNQIFNQGNCEDFQPLDPHDCQYLLKVLMIEAQGIDFKWNQGELPLLCQIIKKRVEVFKLPVILTDTGLIATQFLVDNPGKAVTLLIDFLNYSTDQKFTATNLCKLYPYGFYTQKKFDEYVDTQIKTRKVKWSEIY